MVDPEDRRLGKDRAGRGVEGARALARSRPKGFSTITRAPFGAARGFEVGDDLAEEGRRDRQVVQRMQGAAELAAQGVKGLEVVVGALDVAEPLEQPRERLRVGPP